MFLHLDQSWRTLLGEENVRSLFHPIETFLKEKQLLGEQIYPILDEIFLAYQMTPVDKVKVVILGQDPYHGPNQAHGLAFSVLDGAQKPPSLKNIEKEIFNDLSIAPHDSGNLTRWAKQGVFLLNSILTVTASRPGSHKKSGREQFTDMTITRLSQERSGIVFLLRGKFASSKKQLIDASKHHLLEAPHPSPLSAYRGFFGCNHFSKTNDYLEKAGKRPIVW